MLAIRIFLTSALLLVAYATVGEGCFAEIASALKSKKKTVEYKGCYPEDQMETGPDAKKTAMERLHSQPCNDQCKGSHPKSEVFGLGRGHCWCGFKNVGNQVANHNCDVDCPGKVRESCGSNNFVSIYSLA